MPVVQTDIKSKIKQLASDAFQGFCEDISGMFDIDIKCALKEEHTATVQNIQNHFKKFTAINIITATGFVKGDFLLVFDQKGLFILPGIISMVSEKEILENIEKSSEKEAEDVKDALDECGNLLVGSWDRIFREKLSGHDSLVHSDSFIGVPWSEPEKSIGLSIDQEVLFISYEMTIGSYPSFTCGVIFPRDIFALESDTTQDIEQTQHESETENTGIHQTQNIKQSLSSKFSDISSESKSVSAGNIMQKNVIWISKDDTVETAISKMKEHDAGYLMVGSEDVMEGTMLEGIVSRSDIAGAVSPYLRSTFAKWRRPIDDATLQIRIKWIMSRPVRTVKLDAPVSVIMENMNRYGGRCLPVVDDQGKVVGIVTVFDIFNSLLTESGIFIVGQAGQPPLFV
ncbi:MAG: CBS domain-containing protein [Planctomycetota bacterium]|jgi:CBS domain-containing protein